MPEPLFEFVPQVVHGGRPFGLKVKVSRLPNRDIVLDYEDGTQEVLSAARWCLAGPNVEAALPWWQAAVTGLGAVTGRPVDVVTRELRELVYRLQVDAGAARNNKPFSAKERVIDSLVDATAIMFRTMAYFKEVKHGK
jgi:hypothetical protein